MTQQPNEKIRILLCEDDENLGMLLREYVQAKGYTCDLLPDGEAGFKAYLKGSYDIVITDVMMPKRDGFSLASDIREVNQDVPVIFLTAKSQKEDILEGFRLGGDDYITKPFSMEELLFRIEAIMRRVRGKKSKDVIEYRFGNVRFEVLKQHLYVNQSAVKLTSKESELLNLLCQHANEVLERNYALKSIWVDDNYFNARSMDVYITKLRKHFKDAEGVEILNVHGKGYKLAAPQFESVTK